MVAVGPPGDVRALVDALSGPSAPGRVAGVEVAEEAAAGGEGSRPGFTLG